jgi:ubiquinone/menaquinone biosynthesis C-methylase UbiE
MKEKLKKSVSDSLEAGSLLSFMPYLLQDLWSLGSSVDEIIQAVRELNLPSEKTKVLDLGCGKGAVAVKLASECGFKVTGIDAMESFLNDARKKANEFNVGHLCTFINQDILEYIKKEGDYAIVIFASLGGIFGSFRDTILKLRRLIKNGGYIIIDDGFLKEGVVLNRKGYLHYRSYDETIKELTFFNDRIVNEINTTDLNREINYNYLGLIKPRAEELINIHPELTSEIRNYIKTQGEECKILDEMVEGRVWLLQKTN